MTAPTLSRSRAHRPLARPRSRIAGRAPDVDGLHARIVAAFADAGVGAHDCDLDALAESVLADALRIATAWLEAP
ncbi:MAG: hypothetical protein JO180_01710 [Gemmatirosa sp.]|nr:hypothetical protein [Gemmatirosa sp.]